MHKILQSAAKVAAVVMLVCSQWVWALPPGSVNVNTADTQTLAEKLQGVGQSRAEAIVEFREKFGAFTHLDNLLEVRGIGPQVIEANRDKIAFND